MIAKTTETRQICLWLAIALLCVIEVTALAVFGSGHLSHSAFWYDESMQFWMSLGGDAFGPPHSPPGGLRDVIHQNAVTNLDPGGFTLVFWIWLKLARGVLWQRTLPFVFFLFGMACLGWMAWSRRHSVPFAIFGSLVPALDPLLLNYATEVRAYSMEFAGIVFGCILLDRALLRREILPALFAGFGFAFFLGSRYSFALFAAAASPTPGPAPSDARLKINITPVAVLPNGLTLYSYQFRRDPTTTYVGVLAQDLLKSENSGFRHALVVGSDGYYAVNYDALGLKMLTLDEWHAVTVQIAV